MAMDNALAQTLEMLGQAARDLTDDWWLIGSAAVALHGGRIPHVKDVDDDVAARRR